MEKVGGYEIVRGLAEGRLGGVWLARSRGGRQLAVRVVRAELAADPAFRTRLQDEVVAIRGVGGLHTAPVVDADPDAAAPWLATAYVPGPTLAQLLASEGPLDEPRLRALGVALAEALDEVHRCGLVHRDLKPGNVVMAADGPRVLDFSLARVLRDPRFGTPGFLAPEQAAGLDPGPAADVFALGAVLVAAAGGTGVGGTRLDGTRLDAGQRDANLAALPEPLRPVAAACLEQDPDRRPGTDQLLDWLSPLTSAPAPAAAAPAGSPAAVPGPQSPAGSPAAVPGPQAPAAPQAAVPGTPPVPPAPAGPPAPPAHPHPGSPAPAMPGPAVPGSPAPAMPGPAVPGSPAPAMPGPAVPASAPAMPGPPAYPPAPPLLPPPSLSPSPYAPGAAIPPMGAGAAPEFLAMDRRNAVVLDAEGMSLGSDGSTVTFPWPAIDVAWCEKAPGRGHVLAVALALHDGTVHSCEVTTRDPGELAFWIGQFNATLEFWSPEE